jgi:ppGpp synthetase/RelA/SpoT-type nucleotidyltranferase
VSANSPPINEIFKQHLLEVDFWRSVAATAERVLREVLRQTRIPGKVEARTKTTGSVIGKVYRKPTEYTSLSRFKDLAGARVLVPFAADVEPIALEIHNHPDMVVAFDEVKKRKPTEIKYQARHLDLVLDPGSFGLQVPAGFDDREIFCEVQIQTFAQSLWANVSHLVTYKRDPLPEEVHARVNRLVVLCEVFDDEVAASRSLAEESIDTVARTAEELQRSFFGITGEVHDPDQAVSLVARLLPALHTEEQVNYPSILELFISDYGQRLTLLLTDRPEARGLPWLLRPEVLLIFERITNAPSSLRAAWAQEFPIADLDALEAAWGPTDQAT